MAIHADQCVMTVDRNSWASHRRLGISSASYIQLSSASAATLARRLALTASRSSYENVSTMPKLLGLDLTHLPAEKEHYSG